VIHSGSSRRRGVRKWVGATAMAWLLWSDLTVIERDNPLDVLMLRWLAGIPRLQTDRMRVDSFATAEACKAGLERYMGTLKRISDSWSERPFERDGDVATIRYFRRGSFYAKAALRCAEQ
jgi:hypothetical protein